jgi:hypothetical protein
MSYTYIHTNTQQKKTNKIKHCEIQRIQLRDKKKKNPLKNISTKYMRVQIRNLKKKKRICVSAY